jgi:hypothetical protein
MTTDPFTAWQNAGAITYSVPGGLFVFYQGKVWAVALNGYVSADTHFRQPLSKVGIPVCDWPESGVRALEMLGDDRLLIGLGAWQQGALFAHSDG